MTTAKEDLHEWKIAFNRSCWRPMDLLRQERRSESTSHLQGRLPFHYGNRNQFGHFPGNARVMNDLNDSTDVLVGIGFFFREP